MKTEEENMEYKTLYKELAWILTHLGCTICDHDFLGFCNYTLDKRAFIYIKPSLSFKHKFFTLAHEAGHLFHMKKGSVFNWSKKARSEEQANWFAVQFLKRYGISSKEYYVFYSKAQKRGRKYKSWFEL
jgi:hypothetical protein